FTKEKSVNLYASDLVKQVVELRQGKFLEDLADCSSLDFCIGVAGYPEKHFEAANLQTDIQNLKIKVDAGADYVITQMFFDNQSYYHFVKECRSAGIKVPIIPGLKVLKSVGQLKTVPRTFHCDLPNQLVQDVLANPGHVEEIGQRWASSQVKDLLQNGHQNIHFYVMNDMHLVKKVIEKVD
ncbi:MAG: methylenetetrahydrofolate reductase, partial [Bdellovibrionales bacterium]